LLKRVDLRLVIGKRAYQSPRSQRPVPGRCAAALLDARWSSRVLFESAEERSW